MGTKSETYKIIKNLSLILPAHVESDYSGEFEINECKHEEKVVKYLNSEITDDEIIRKLSNLKNLTLQLTRNCNWRCAYCAFSGLYPENRTHSPEEMSLETGKKAVDMFLWQLHSPYRSIREYPAISLYGGEPFLAWDTMIALIDYVKNHPLSKKIFFKFIATTNGSLLSQERIYEIVKRGLRVDISIDGPRAEHNKFRVTANGEGTWDSIIKNVIYFSNKYPDYFKYNVRFFLTLHPSHNLLEIERFLLENDDIFNENNVFINQLNQRGLQIEDPESWESQRKELSKQINHGLKKDKWVYLHFIAKGFEEKFGAGTLFLDDMTMFTGTCFPGAIRLFVDVDGNFHVCEKMHGNFPFGHVDRGFDLKAIKNIVMKWRKQILNRKCWKCPSWYFCSFCFARNFKDNDFKIAAKDCKELQGTIERRMIKYLSYKEALDEEKCNSITGFDSFMDTL